MRPTAGTLISNQPSQFCLPQNYIVLEIFRWDAIKKKSQNNNDKGKETGKKKEGSGRC